MLIGNVSSTVAQNYLQTLAKYCQFDIDGRSYNRDHCSVHQLNATSKIYFWVSYVRYYWNISELFNGTNPFLDMNTVVSNFLSSDDYVKFTTEFFGSPLPSYRSETFWSDRFGKQGKTLSDQPLSAEDKKEKTTDSTKSAEKTVEPTEKTTESVEKLSNQPLSVEDKKEKTVEPAEKTTEPEKKSEEKLAPPVESVPKKDASLELDPEFLTRVQQAFNAGKTAELTKLIRMVPTEFSNKLLLVAASRGRYGYIQPLLDNGANINYSSWIEGLTALHYAALFKRPETTKTLIRLGANVDAQDSSGSTPLHYAELKNIILPLLEAGANPTIPNQDGYLPRKYRSTQECIDLLDKYSKPIEIVKRCAVTPQELEDLPNESHVVVTSSNQTTIDSLFKKA